MSNLLKDIVWRQNMNASHTEKDTYKDENKKGVSQRFLETLAGYYDEAVYPTLDDFLGNIGLPRTVLSSLIGYLEDTLGVDLIIDASSLPTRRKVMEYWFELCQTRSTPLGIDATVRLIVFPKLKVYTVVTDVDYKTALPYAAKNAYYKYEIRITGTLMGLTPNLLRSFHTIADWHEPINWKMRDTGIMYNGQYIPKNLVQFFFDNDPPYPAADPQRSPNLFIDISANPLFFAEFTNQGHLILNGNWANYYEFDAKYGRNQGRMLFRQPSLTAWELFDVNHATNVEKTAFTITWAAVAGAISYEVVVGRKTRDEIVYTLEETPIDDKVRDFAPAVGTSYIVTGLDEQTVYFYMVWANDADGRRTHSDIKWVLTRRTVAAPVALPAAHVWHKVFTAVWEAVPEASGYRLDVATDAGFTNLLLDNFLLDQPVTRWRVAIPSIGTYYYRVRAIHHRIDTTRYGSKCIESVSENSNTIAVTAVLYDFGYSFGFDFNRPPNP